MTELSLLIGIWNESPAFVQVILFLLIWLGLWLPIAIAIATQVKWRPFQPATPQQKLPLLASLYVLAPLLLWGLVSLEGGSLQQYGLNWTINFAVSFSQGLGLGVFGILILMGLQVSLGWRAKGSFFIAQNGIERSTDPKDPNIQNIQSETETETETETKIESSNSSGANNSQPLATAPPQLKTIIIPLLLLASWIGLTEELIFRGFIQTQLQIDFSLSWAAAIASLIFAVSHVLWEGRQQVPQLPGLWLMGMVLVLARWADGGSLGLAWGLHSGWIWSLACLDTAQRYQLTGKGPIWLTGTLEQPLFGLMPLLLLLGTALSVGAIFGL